MTTSLVSQTETLDFEYSVINLQHLYLDILFFNYLVACCHTNFFTIRFLLNHFLS